MVQIPVIDAQLPVQVAPESEHVTFVRDKTTMLGPAAYRNDQNFETEALGQVEGAFGVVLVRAVAQLALIVVAPREKLRVTALQRLLLLISTPVVSRSSFFPLMIGRRHH